MKMILCRLAGMRELGAYCRVKGECDDRSRYDECLPGRRRLPLGDRVLREPTFYQSEVAVEGFWRRLKLESCDSMILEVQRL